jgi:hypothetical protein
MNPALSLRDEFAFAAMGALLTYRGTERKPAVLAKNAYHVADAMLRARGAEGPTTLRDDLARRALAGLIAGEGISVKLEITCRIAYELADGMLAVRGQEQK